MINNKNIDYSLRAFTIIELMVTIAVMAVALGLAAPSFSNLLKNNRMISMSNEVVSALSIARQVAISRGVHAFVCPSGNADTDSPSCINNVDYWADGVLVYTKPKNTTLASNAFSNTSYDSTDDTLVFQSAFGDRSRFIVTQNSMAGNLAGFSAQGLEYRSSTPSLSFCDDRIGDYGREIFISPVGRVLFEVKTCT